MLVLKKLKKEITIFEALPYHKNIARYLFHDGNATKLRIFYTKYSSTLDACLKYKRNNIEKRQSSMYTLKELVFFSYEIIRGIEFLHKHSVIHRDIKSENVSVHINERKEISLLAISEFDSAKRIGKYGTKTVIGTLNFIAPEIFTGGGLAPYTFKADVFSYGQLLYELITLHQPYYDISLTEIQKTVIDGIHPKIPDTVPAELKVLIDLHRKCIGYTPDVRPDSTQVREELGKLRVTLEST